MVRKWPRIRRFCPRLPSHPGSASDSCVCAFVQAIPLSHESGRLAVPGLPRTRLAGNVRTSGRPPCPLRPQELLALGASRANGNGQAARSNGSKREQFLSRWETTVFLTPMKRLAHAHRLAVAGQHGKAVRMHLGQPSCVAAGRSGSILTASNSCAPSPAPTTLVAHFRHPTNANTSCGVEPDRDGPAARICGYRPSRRAAKRDHSSGRPLYPKRPQGLLALGGSRVNGSGHAE